MSLSALASRLAARLRSDQPLRPNRRAAGTVDAHNAKNRRLVVTVDAETFDFVGRAADAAGISQSEAIRQLLKRGIAAAAPSASEGPPRQPKTFTTPGE